MPNDSSYQSLPRGHNRSRRIAARILFPAFAAALFALALFGCATKTDREPGITLLDFKTQNVERLLPGIDRLAGEDSAGREAREYLRSYLEDISRFSVSGKSEVEPPEPERHPNEELASLYSGASVITKFTGNGSRNPDPQTRQFLDYLKGRRLEAISNLRKNHESFTAVRSPATAKMGLVNAFIASTAMPSTSDLELIVDLVDPLLKELTTNYH